ncbi:hypothetical protein EVAR_59667_1 [Eumeta japonica]|uniref:Uncharacterized protein n=1 Tax=Eumeta variegata TaxID=151549 RepID=A0A4C1Z079_EUMVA|nr:hypothetical protein EVAR_59667_1 [Eumeta japonica]
MSSIYWYRRAIIEQVVIAVHSHSSPRGVTSAGLLGRNRISNGGKSDDGRNGGVGHRNSHLLDGCKQRKPLLHRYILLSNVNLIGPVDSEQIRCDKRTDGDVRRTTRDFSLGVTKRFNTKCMTAEHTRTGSAAGATYGPPRAAHADTLISNRCRCRAGGRLRRFSPPLPAAPTLLNSRGTPRA